MDIKLSLVIPTFNEAGNIGSLIKRIDNSLRKSKINYEIIVVDDHSNDDTNKIVNSLTRDYPLSHFKKGKKGKSYSLLEGFGYAKYGYVCMIDGDLQFPPEAIPEMISLLDKNGLVIAERKSYFGSPLRKLASKINEFVFGKLILGLPYDIQSGLKVFKKELISHIDPKSIGEWSLDIPLVYTAAELGYKIGTVDITYEKRRSGVSKVNIFKTTLELTMSALKTRLLHKKIYKLLPETKNSAIGAGIIKDRRRFITHTLLPLEKSAVVTFLSWQKVLLFIIFLVFVSGLLLSPRNLLIFSVAILSLIYFIDTIFNLFILQKSLHKAEEITSTPQDLSEIDPTKVPIYSILCPMHKEEGVLPQFIEGISKLDWPKEKLDVLLLLEEDDVGTIDKVNRMNLPPYIKPLIVPDSLPKTKPKACNYGLVHARGEYVVIYDAEDIPDPDQLKKAHLGFLKSPKNVICLQAKLNYYNPGHNLLTRLFTAEYSLWFDIILPGLQAINTTIPLGGTSNHFRKKDLLALFGWDPFNVTEDCDLGVRLFREGYKTAIIDSTTLEEANSRFGNWLRQRSRWIKGYIQTYFIHNREPLKFIKKHGFQTLVFQLVIGGRIAFILINPILWATTISYFIFRPVIGVAIESIYPAPVFYIAVTSLVIGNFVCLINYMVGLAKRKHWILIKYVYLVPLYWLMVSSAAIKAVFQLIIKPHYWEKTQHGFHLDATFSFVAPNPKVRILIFNWRDTKHVYAGGAEVYIDELAKRWVEKGNEVTIFCGNDGNKNRNENVNGINIIRRGGFYLVYLWAFLYYEFKFKGKFDVVIDSQNGIPFFTPLYVREKIFGLMFHVHQEVFLKSLLPPLAQIASFLEKRIVPRIYAGTEFITISPSTKTAMESIGIGQTDIHIIYPGVDMPVMRTRKRNKNPTILYLGRLKFYKSVSVLLKAAKTIIDKFPNLQIVIAGEGEEKYNLMKLANRLGISKIIKFTGRVSEYQKSHLYQKAWVFVNPSLIEGWGLTSIEANSYGTPVVASDVPGLRDSVKNPHTGYLVQYGNEDKFAEKIKSLLSDKSVLKKMGRNSVSWAKKFSWDKSAKELLEIIRHTTS